MINETMNHKKAAFTENLPKILKITENQRNWVLFAIFIEVLIISNLQTNIIF
jgi:hypothetical protein